MKKSERKNINEQDKELQAKVEPVTRGERILRGIITAAVIAVVGAIIAYFANFMLEAKDIKTLSEILSNTIKTNNAEFTATIKDKASDIKLCGAIEKKAKDITVLCDVDYGKRDASICLSTDGYNAYLDVESDVANDYMRLDITAIRYALGDKSSVFEWSDILSALSTDDIKLADFYNADKIDDAVAKVRKTFASPTSLTGILDCNIKGDELFVDIDVYSLMLKVADAMGDAFKTPESQKNLIKLIRSEKKSLREATVHVVLTVKDGIVVKLSAGTAKKADILVMELKNHGKTSVKDDCDIASSAYKSAAFDVAFRRILRAGLDEKAAYTEATRCLNAFAEHFSYNIKAGTIVVVYDEDKNDFQFVYSSKYALETIEYGEELYNAWGNGYVALDTANLDSGSYKVMIYEPASGKKEEADADDYNNAYLAATQAVNAFVASGFTMTENAVFVVIENETEFQFIFQNNRLYDVYQQYYYFVYQDSYGLADMSKAEGVPENVKLYIPKLEVNDK